MGDNICMDANKNTNRKGKTMIDFGTMNTTAAEHRTISTIARIARENGYAREHLDIAMDLEACHAVCPLDLEALATAKTGDLLHDVSGIAAHLDRDTGQLTDCFHPRHAV